MRIKISIPGAPVPKGRPRFSFRSKKPIAYTPQKTRSAEDIIKTIATATAYTQKWKLSFKPLIVVVNSFRAMPVYLQASNRLKRANNRYTLRPVSRPDADNLGKLVLDALNGIIYRDDSQIVSMIFNKYYSETPRTEIMVQEVPENDK